MEGTGYFEKFITVQFQKEGIHRYPEAATDPNLATGDEYDVSFLANEHFHYFYFTVSLQITDNNREVEFIQFRRWLEKLYDAGTLQLNNKSCEMIAEDLINKINAEHPNKKIRVKVFEDNINGADITWHPKSELLKLLNWVGVRFI